MDMNLRERILQSWFEMWLRQRDLGIQNLFSPEAVYVESWGPEYHGAEKIQHWFEEWNTRGRVLRWDIRQFLHQGNQTVAEWYFLAEMKDQTRQEFEGLSLVRWSQDNKIVFLQEFGCNLNRYDPYENGPHPIFQQEPVRWFSSQQRPPLLEMGALISKEDPQVAQELAACQEDISAYFLAHQERYENRGIFEPQEPDVLSWIGLIDCLMEHSCACELDWKCELEDFLYGLSGLKQVEREGLPLESQWFDPAASIEEWGKLLSQKWSPLGIGLGEFYLDSDSYVLFAAPGEAFPALEKAAAALGQGIERL